MADIKTDTKIEASSGPDTPPTNKEDVAFAESASNSSQEFGFDEKQTKTLIRKIDWALLPFLALLYLLSFLDRSRSTAQSSAIPRLTWYSQHWKCSSRRS
jgi:hypothetical protein